MAVIRVVAGLFLMVTIIFLPTGVALIRRHKNLIPIFLVNFIFIFFFGLGWVVALIWSFTSNVKETRSITELVKALQDGSLAKEQD